MKTIRGSYEALRKSLKLGHGYTRLELELIQALRDARELLCSQGDPDEDSLMIERIDALLKLPGDDE